MSKIIELLTTPIMFMNMFSGIIGGIWLAIIGEWSLIGFGLILLFTSHWYLMLLMLPGMAITAIAVPFIKRQNPLQYFFGYLSQLYTNILIVGWCIGSFIVCTNHYNGPNVSSIDVVPYALWSWGMGLGPWQFFASKEPDNEFTMITTFSASAFYLLFLISFFLLPGLSLIIIFLFIFVHSIVLPIYNIYFVNKMESEFF